MPRILRYSPLFALLLLSACVSTPTGPSVMVLPGSDKNFEQFQVDDGSCRQFAHYQLGGSTADQAGIDSGVRSAALGTVLGAAAGAAMNGSRGASAGAGVGLLFGGLSGAGAANSSGNNVQRRYDHAYQQCMYAKGHRIPVSGRFGSEMHNELQAPASSYAVPPPNTPPPSRY
ncbi:glycine zipper family protein [Noviherbaspirillum sedimenti]|uniref:Glycine-zipper-containing OmpA-like membrane domain-containing protein n=1 Tax=Noviherbaspirillum sedimenti TaxID=2320865 RepID=A0A3A3FZ37_9BURK|nr:glycine zipper family protein [Noviherbaspirillum sedimenti]RJG00984.1 hypothetical protein D3878_04755 [Noviherbaspirillum sedimenti]